MPLASQPTSFVTLRSYALIGEISAEQPRHDLQLRVEDRRIDVAQRRRVARREIDRTGKPRGVFELAVRIEKRDETRAEILDTEARRRIHRVKLADRRLGERNPASVPHLVAILHEGGAAIARRVVDEDDGDGPRALRPKRRDQTRKAAALIVERHHEWQRALQRVRRL